MKYNTMSDYKDFLKKSLSSSTANSYFQAIDFLLSDQHQVDNIDIPLVFDKLQEIKYKNQYSKHKNALLKFCKFQGIELDNDTLSHLKSMNTDKKKKYRKQKPVKLADIKNRIRAIHDKKLKLSYQTLLQTGMRVSELSQIGKSDCIIDKNSIEFEFDGKGNRKEKVVVYAKDNQRYFDSLLLLMDETLDGKKLFYSSGYLKNKATALGFQCHDLRRAFAKLDLKENKDLKGTMKKMRHKDEKTTRIYTKSKVDIDE